jgi:adenine-specific DNA-methyltransferase
MTKEEKFFNALKDIFVGAKVEGESGYINLMRIKSNYFQKKIFPQLQKDIDQALEPFPEFREELFDKLYNFFYRYFSESGSIYFRYTPFHQNVYEKVYTDDRDVILFWKTHMLYYVKTDRLFNNLDVEVDGLKFFFDVSTLQHKKANEKRQTIYELKEVRKDKTIVFNVAYSERKRSTKPNDIIKTLNKEGITVTEEILDKAFKVFEKQSEVDYFINKNAKEFLKEQFNLWLYQYVFSGESEWTDKRIKQLQVLKDIAYKIIDFISQFEDELVKIWNKPKFVLNSNYVITLDRIADKEIELIEELLKHKNFEKQQEEWKELGIIDEKFEKNQIFENRLDGKQLKKEYQHLPIDTKYFKNLELEILGLFDDLDNSLDGWLIKSENYQALNTILPKFKEKVQTIYIDPPFNKEQDTDYFYSVKYKDSSWATMLENRLQIAKDVLNPKGSIFVRCDYNGNWIVRPLMDDIFGKENFRNELMINRTSRLKNEGRKYYTSCDSLFLYSKNSEYIFEQQRIEEPFEAELKMIEGIDQEEVKKFLENVLEDVEFEIKGNKLRVRAQKWIEMHASSEKVNNEPITVFGKVIYPPKKRRWMWKDPETIRKMEKMGWIRINPHNNLPELLRTWRYLGSDWTDIKAYSQTTGFKTENSEELLQRVINTGSQEKGFIIDFFLGSGTTTAVAHKLGRKWIGVEMGEHFYTVVLPRMKKVLFYDKSGISKEKDVKEKYNKDNAGGFFKYYELEQYEDTLRNVKYDDYDLFNNPYQDPYNQYVFMRDLKMLETLEIDYENNKVNVDLSKLYSNIDIAETLSNLTGKWIKRITPEYVEFEDGEKIDINNLDYKLIKPLIWW